MRLSRVPISPRICAARGALRRRWSRSASPWPRTRDSQNRSTTSAPTPSKKSCAQAEKLLRAAVAAKPSLATAHYNLALALGCLGRRAEERAGTERAARLDFSNADILNNLGVALTSSGKPARAEAALRRAVSNQPGRRSRTTTSATP